MAEQSQSEKDPSLHLIACDLPHRYLSNQLKTFSKRPILRSFSGKREYGRVSKDCEKSMTRSPTTFFLSKALHSSSIKPTSAVSRSCAV